MKQYECKSLLPDIGSVVCDNAEKINAVIYHLTHNGFFEAYQKRGFFDETKDVRGVFHEVEWNSTAKDYNIFTIPASASVPIVTFHDYFTEIAPIANQASDVVAEDELFETATEKEFFMEHEILHALVKEYGYDYILDQVKKFENLT